MTFKLGDKVFGKDVVNKSYYTGRIIEINHNQDDWASYCIDTVYGNKWLINDTITKVEGENDMKFKKGDIVEVIQKDYSGGKPYEVGSRWEVLYEYEGTTGKRWDVVYVKDETRVSGRALLYTSNVKKVDEQPDNHQDELMIPISLVYQVLESEPTNREIKAFLKGYKEGLSKNKTTD